MKKILAIIPARGGSKGIPKKNIIPLAGLPLIGHNLKAAKNSEYIDRVVVSTDSTEIAATAKKFGAEVCLRPDRISGDFSSSEEALLHVLETLKNQEEYVPDIVVFMQCTSPLTTTDDIDGMVKKFLEKDADSALSVTPFHYYVWEEENGVAHGVNHDNQSRVMRQERRNQFLENGALYVMKTKGFVEHKFRFFGKTIMYEMPLERSFEIDEPIDLSIAESMMTFVDK